MAPIFTTFKNATRAGVLALALGTASLSAMPVQAQEPSVNFQLDLGNGAGTQQFGTEARRGGGGGRHDNFRGCLNDRQIVRGLSSYGFRNVDIRRNLGRDRVEVRGSYGRWTYSMRVDRCSGRVDRVERLRPSFPGGGGFGLQFNFSK